MTPLKNNNTTFPTTLATPSLKTATTTKNPKGTIKINIVALAFPPLTHDFQKAVFSRCYLD